jgi:hypothetical protein
MASKLLRASAEMPCTSCITMAGMTAQAVVAEIAVKRSQIQALTWQQFGQLFVRYAWEPMRVV